MRDGLRCDLLPIGVGLSALALGLVGCVERQAIAPLLEEWWRVLWATLERADPVTFFAAFALLTLGPIPASAFYVTAAPLFGLGVALIGIFCAMVLNMSLAHWAASGVMRPIGVRIIEKLGYRVPGVSAENERHVIVLVRVAPGVPYFAQNLILGLAGVRYWPYLAISVPIQMGWALGFVLLGESAMEGRVGVGIAAVSMLVVAGVATRLIRRRMAATEEGRLELESLESELPAE
jgi:uncharacterized membrane protein YdjX (TVP38/TMEM64 family)